MIDRRIFLGAASAAPFAFDAAVARAARLPAATRDDATDVSELRALFDAPPLSARPWVYWFWINGNVTREGVTADLEAMARVGIGGVLLMDVDPGTPPGPALFGTDAWRALMAFALTEASRLGIEVRLNNDAGWSGSAGPWITPALSMQKLVWTEAEVTGGQPIDLALAQPATARDYYRDVVVLAFPTPADDGYRLPEIAFKSGAVANDIDHLVEQGVPPMPDPADLPAGMTIDPAQVVDLSKHMTDGRLRWAAPAGRWTVMRFGHTSTGSDNHPVSAAGQGLECDKFSTEAVRVHFDHFAGKVAAMARAMGHNPLSSVHIDSWEAGPQNWSTTFAEEFARRRGYDPLRYLPAMSGRAVGGAALAERFLWDVRQTISDLVIENYAGAMRRMASAAGLRLSIEAYDGDQTAQLSYAAQADEPQAEFWLGRDFFPGVHRSWDWVAGMTSAAHVYGKPIVGAEAFTAMPGENWQAHPATMKPLADWAFTRGINRLIVHRFAMQPWLNRAPGMTMGSWGTHYDRTQTWWETTGPWHAYLQRCQAMLRQGVAVADLLYLTPEGAPMRFAAPGVDMESAAPPDNAPYASDGCPPAALFDRISIVDGLIALPDGARYRVLVLPDPAGDMRGAGTMSPRLLRRIAELVEQGMTVIGPRPIRAPGLSGYPASDAEVRTLAERLWGPGDGPVERQVGAGRVVSGVAPEIWLARAGVPGDFTCDDVHAFRYGHRRLADGTDVYFVANKQDGARHARCRFRAAGRRAQLWDAETGRVRHPIHAASDGATTTIELSLPAHGSTFVIFPPQGTSSVVPMLTGDGALPPLDRGADGTLTITTAGPLRTKLRDSSGGQVPVEAAAPPPPVGVTGPWSVRFPPNWGAPAGITLPALTSWTDHLDAGVKHFSGTAMYRAAIDVPAMMLARDLRLFLDLGEVADVARLSVGGREVGIAWKAPFELEVTGMLRPGVNQLEVAVTNRWPNRIIGDAALPDDVEWKPGPFEGLPGFGDTLVRWPQWLLDGKPSPTGRYTFATWRTIGKDTPLLRSGLLGPVILRARRIARLNVQG